MGHACRAAGRNKEGLHDVLRSLNMELEQEQELRQTSQPPPETAAAPDVASQDLTGQSSSEAGRMAGWQQQSGADDNYCSGAR